MILTAFIAAALSQGAAGAPLSVMNGTNEPLVCGIKKAGSAAHETVTIRPGQSWTKSYEGTAKRRFRCQTPMGDWQTVLAGQQYKLVKNKGGLVVLRPTTR